ncbi:MAG TPA: glycosyltransferase [Gaiellales bacterium]|nr:glycosyltransferase [Gaiellales bacterium]
MLNVLAPDPRCLPQHRGGRRREARRIVEPLFQQARRRAILRSDETYAVTKVVITMPAYHAEETLERTVAAIPVGVADELILVDDASLDDTVEVARKLNITVYVHDENLGYGGNQKTPDRRGLSGNDG